MLSLRELVSEVGLELAAGADAADAPLRWVHITELPDPTPFLSGGELLLTTGMQLDGEERQRELVRRLADHRLAGLGLGTGFDHAELPPALLDEARKLGFPLFEVPYEVPFIAITEKAFTRLVNEEYEVLRRGIEIHKRLERVVLEERGLGEVARAIAAAIGGAVLVLSAHGEVLASRGSKRELDAEVTAALAGEVRRRADGARGGEFAPEHPEVEGRALVLPVSVGGETEAWVAAVRDDGPPGDFEHLILRQSTTVVALELMRRRAMRDTERRLAGDVLADVVGGRVDERELRGRLAPFGIGNRAAVLVFGAPALGAAAEAELEAFFASAGIGALVAARERMLCAVVDAGDDPDTVELAGRARAALTGPGVRAGVSRAGGAGDLRRSFHEARCALEAAALATGEAPEVASYRDLGAFQLLLALQDDEALRLYCDSVLGSLENGPGEYGDELVRSLEAFLEHNGQWERAARALFCHRHTLRYRIRRVEELTGRDLSTARDRIEFWLALRARELIA